MVIDKELRHRSPYFYTFFPQKDLIPAELPEIKPRIMPVAAFQTDLFQLTSDSLYSLLLVFHQHVFAKFSLKHTLKLA